MILSRRVVRAKGSKKGTERRERCVNNLHSDESIVLRRGRTRPLQLWHSALPRLQPSCSTRIPFEPGYSTNRLHPSGTSDPSLSRCPPIPFSSRIVLSRSLAHFSTDIARVPFHSEKFNYNRNYHFKKVLLANPRRLTIATIPSFTMVVPSCERKMRFFRIT